MIRTMMVVVMSTRTTMIMTMPAKDLPYSVIHTLIRFVHKRNNDYFDGKDEVVDEENTRLY